MRTTRAYWTDLIMNRTVPALFFAIFVVYQLLNVLRSIAPILDGAVPGRQWLLALNEVMLLAYYVLLVVLYVVRLPKKGANQGLLRAGVAFVTSFVVVPAILVPVSYPQLIDASTALVALGVGYALYALLHLRRSFSILPEARRLVTGGPYSLSRHPLYLGEVVAAAGLLLPRLNAVTILVFVLLLGGQYLRMGWEEAALTRFFAEYADYRRRVPRYLPKLPFTK